MIQVSTCWDQATSLTESLSILRDFSLRHAHLGGLHGEKIAKLIRQSDYRGLALYDLPVNNLGWDLSQLIHCRQALGFFQKFENLDIGVDKRSVAAAKFDEAELKCAATNDLFRSWHSGRISFRPDVVRKLHAARRKIARILGPCPSFDELALRFGPGATTSNKKRDACVQNKLAGPITCSTNLYHSGLVPSLMREFPHWLDARAENYSLDDEDYVCAIIDVKLTCGKLSFVPKNAKTYRAIVVEPLLNSLVQCGIGDYMEGRLRRAGIDIRDQTRNQRMAREGSLTQRFATLDLSSASDTVSRQLVKELLPEQWYALLCAARSDTVYCRETKKQYVLEKMSSMGNGFTFPLETLIFWALTASCCEFAVDTIGVYGDDIICPREYAQDVIALLHHCGFEVGLSKSFVEGPFRESCGGDYYLGISVRPFYQKHLVSGETLFSLHNFYYRAGDLESADYVKARIPLPLRIYGPDGYGDGHLLGSHWGNSGKRAVKLRSKGYCGTLFSTYTHKGRRSVSRYPGDWVTPLYTIYRRGAKELFPNAPSSSALAEITEPGRTEFDPSGRPIWTLPGTQGYKKVEIYTLLTPSLLA